MTGFQTLCQTTRGCVPGTSGTQECSAAADLPVAALNVLKRLKFATVPPSFPTLQLSATVYVGGYIARIVQEHAACEDCCAVTSKPVSAQPLQQLTLHQDRGGLLYPSDKLLYVLETLRHFVAIALVKQPMLKKPLIDCGV